MRAALVFAASLALGTAVFAALIGVNNFVNSAYPRTDAVASNGAVNFDAASRILSITISDQAGSSPFSTRWNPLAGAMTFPHLLSPTSNSMSIYIRINDMAGLDYSGCVTVPGSCVPAIPGGTLADFVLMGSYDINGNGNALDMYENGVLLKGSITQFGFLNPPNQSQDSLDFHFAPTGGLWVDKGWYQGKDIGVVDKLETNNWPAVATGVNSFTASFQASSKLSILAVDCNATIGDFVWDDSTNRNGLQDPSEPGINGVTVKLYQGNVNVGPPFKTAVTVNSGNAPGFYKFAGLCQGDYTVVIDAPPNGFDTTVVEAGSDRTIDSNNTHGAPVTLGITPTTYSNQTIDFGFQSCMGSIGDFVWHDLNRNGVQDLPMEPGIGNIRVKLEDQNGIFIRDTITAGDGSYHFTGLCAGTYQIEADQATLPGAPGDFTPTATNVGGNPAVDSNPSPATVTLATDISTDSTIDFGYLGKCEGTIGDFVWFDDNHNGIQDPDELGIDGLTVTINPGNHVAVTGTNGGVTHGFYQVTGLCTGNYTVSVSAPPGFQETLPLVGLDRTIDSNSQPASVTLPWDNAADNSIDFGYFSCPGTIGDYVWQDLNFNGIQDASEPGFLGVTVNLRRASDNTIIQTAMTDNIGGYMFTGVCPGAYKVQVEPPPGTDASPLSPPAAGTPPTDSNPNPSPVTLTLAQQSDETIDFGFRARGSIGDYVWKDLNGDGIQNDGGPAAGLGGLPITLVGPTGIQTTTTNASGFYQFNFLTAGAYTLSLPLPSGYFLSPTSPPAGGTPSTDSNGVLIGPFVQADVTLPANDSSNQTLDFGFVPQTPSITIVKKTNGTDNDAVPGPTVAVGSTVTWTYLVTNTGSVPLTAVAVSDDKVGAITCPQTTLASGASMTCTKTGTALAGQYTNIGSVIGTPPSGPNVTSSNPDHYFGQNASIAIVKTTNGTDNNVAPGPIVPVGSTVTWTYVVTNTGNVPLTAVAVTDDKVGAITCPQTTLAIGASMTCTKTGTALAGQYTNIGTVTGTPPTGPNVTSSNPDNYFGQTAAITIVKKTNGTDNDAVPGPFVAVGSTVTWTYLVTNTGNVPLTAVAVSDDKVGAITCPQTTLAVGGSMTCTKTGTAVAGQYTNIGSVAGTPPTGPKVTSSNPDHYFGQTPSITILKTTNGTDNNVAPGPTVAVGSTVTWTYVVTNTGNVPLTAVAVTDDKVGAITCPQTTLAIGGSMTCTKTGTAVAGQYTNIGTVTGTPPTGPNVTANNPDNYFGQTPDLPCIGGTLVTSGGNDPTSGATGNVKTFSVSGGVSMHVSAFSQNRTTNVFTTAYLGAYSPGLGVTDTSSPSEGTGANDTHTLGNNTQNDYLLFEFDRKVIVDKVGLGYIVGDSDMSVWIGNAPGGVNPFTTHQTLNAALLTSLGFTEVNTATVTSGTRVADINAGGVQGNMLVVAGKIGDTTDKFKVSQLVIGCPTPLALTCAAATGTVGVAYSSAIVANGGVAPYTYSIASGSLPPGLMLNPTTGAITGTPTAAGGYPYTAKVVDSRNNAAGTTTSSCGITVGAATPAVTIVKKTNGTDNNTAPGPIVAIGSTVTWTYLVTNTGNVPLTSLTVTDNKIAGAICSVASLAPGASTTCTKTGTAVAGQYTNIGTVTATGAGTTVTATNPDNYTGFTIYCSNTPGKKKTSYSSSFTSNGGHGTARTYSIASGSLPAGLSLNATTGAITGTPTTSGTYSFTAKVIDADTHSTTTAGSIVIP